MWDLSTALELAIKADRELALLLLGTIRTYATILLLFTITCAKEC